MKILAFAASNAKDSINAQLVKFVSSKFENATVDFVDLNHFEMPIFSIDREKETGIPQLAKDFAEKIDQTEVILISFAEHNGTYTTAFKNIFDWISRIPGRKAFGEKDIFAMATSTGIRGGKGVLETAVNRLPINGGNIITSFSLPKFAENFDVEKGIIHIEHLNHLQEKIEEVKKHWHNKTAAEIEN
jgi:NAD(P)H-dependent FMN reductase